MLGTLSQNNNFTASANASAPQQQQQRVNPIRPLTIKQLLDAQSVGQGVLVVDGREATQAIIIGRIIGYENANATSVKALTAKHYGYYITDNTGKILVRQWVDAESTEDPLPLHTHVRASGSVKVWQDAPVVTGSVVGIADSNEMNFHLLDAILTHLRLVKGEKREAAAPGGFAMNTAAAVGAQNILPGGDTKIPLTDLLISVIQRSGNPDVGLSMDELIAAAQQYNFGPGDVRNALRILASEGKIYQTHDNRFNI
ncbi:unnamed protein product [Phytomonas sp. EM1]|nr:unnamed protein product [Phytomonas sp. EM1]|eukprot:CCW65483.1 unnamed protein product [Phytomonas sp. isolate EM1]